MEVNTRRAAQGARELTPEAFDRLLGALDADRDRAGAIYERIRHKLMSLFRWRGCRSPEELADRTIDRVARRLGGGVELRVADPYLYFHGVALNVLREHWREPDREHDVLDDSSRAQAAIPDSESELQHLEARAAAEQRLECLTRCVRHLSAESRRLIEAYHCGSTEARIGTRKALADELGIPLNALRIRAYRIRASLQGCVQTCLRQSTPEIVQGFEH